MLVGFCLVEVGDDLVDVAEAFGRFTARSEVCGVGLAERFYPFQVIVGFFFAVNVVANCFIVGITVS